ncbi:hypothetical protein [Cupriavidus campinensis]|uniref:DUF4276 family protein n=1 Tax=Cupriavidus campinensis TaxID=151783 RepID=A0ABY3EJ92_9BURK|nr:hypothetical protein [Cupriavidus campinensis]TSP10871.1 hypothetical protein FGG12_20645 [Cupriavidus campinensis]
MKINFVLTGEGTSDLRLVEHIESLLVEEGFAEASGEAPDLSLFNPPIGRSVKDKLRALAIHYPNVDVIFVHRDADGDGEEPRLREIYAAAEHIGPERIVPIIPVTMLETWLLADQKIIKRVAGNVAHKGDIPCIPSLARLEGVVDAKQILLEALCHVSNTQGARLKRFKARYPEMRARLTFDLDPLGPVGHLPSYQKFRARVQEFAQIKLGCN